MTADEERVPTPDPEGPRRKPPKEAIAEARVRAPSRGNRRLEGFLEAVNSDEQVRAWWYMAQVNAERRQRRETMFATLPGGVSMATLETIAACESGGDPTAVSSDGTYRGKYQFDYGTWESVGGHGDPAAAPEAEQDYRAALLYSESGSSPWPVCG